MRETSRTSERWSDDDKREFGRRMFFKGAALVGGVAGLSALAPGAVGSAFAAQPNRSAFRKQLFRNALSVSPFTEEVLASTALTDGTFTASGVADLQRLYNRHGSTEVYARIATKKISPRTGFGLGLERASLAAQLGMPFNPELMLNGNYGDGGIYQDPPDFSDYPEIAAAQPGPWTSLTLDQMVPLIRTYAATVAKQILSTGAVVNYWDLGNEVDQGIAGVTPVPWGFSEGQPAYSPPDAVDPAIGEQTIGNLLINYTEPERIAWSEQHLWPYVARLLCAARDGILSVQPHAKFSTHLGSPANTATDAVPLAFWATMARHGYIPDAIGTSYYPGGPSLTMDAFKQICTTVSRTFKRSIFIAEFAYASGPSLIFGTPSSPYELTVADQKRFTEDLVTWGSTTRVLQGLRWWAPDLCTNPWQPVSLFGSPSNGVAVTKPAIDAVKMATRSLDPNR